MNIDSLVVPELNEDLLTSKIYIIRGQKVMLDFELAQIYGYTTKAFNQQVKNNIKKFDEDFMFRLTKDDKKIWRGQKFLLREIGLYAIKVVEHLYLTFLQNKEYIC